MTDSTNGSGLRSARYTRCPVVGVGTGLCGDLGEVLPTPPAFGPPLTEPLSLLPEDALPPFNLGPKVVNAETARLGELAQIGPSTTAVGDDDDVCGAPLWRWWWCCCWRRMAAWAIYIIIKFHGTSVEIWLTIST